MEGELAYPLHKNEKLAVVSDRYTFEVLGRRIGSALRSEGFAIEEIVWQKPHADLESVKDLRHLTRHSDGLIAVGSGTVNDSVKYASFLDQKIFGFPHFAATGVCDAHRIDFFGRLEDRLPPYHSRGVL